MQWLSWNELTQLPVETALLVDSGEHGVRTRCRVLEVSPEALTVWLRDGTTRTLTDGSFRRARVVDSIYDEGDPVLRVGVPADEWRGGVVRTLAPGLVRVESLEGFEDREEWELEAPEDREARAYVALKPGPPAADSVVDAAAQAAYTGSRAS